MKTIFTFTFILFAAGCIAQLPQCYVSTVTGTVTVDRNAKTLTLKKGDYIFKTDVLTLKPLAAIALIDYTNKKIILNKPGKFTYNDMLQSINIKPTGITEAYFKYIWEDLLKPETEGTLVSAKNIGGAVGGASRAPGCEMISSPACGAKFSDDTINFAWHGIVGARLYRFTLKDQSRNDIINILTKDTAIAILKKELMQGDSSSYYWSITPDINPANYAQSSCFFTITTGPQKEKEIAAVVNLQGNETDALLLNLKISEMLAQKGWYKESYDYYLKARGLPAGN